MREWTLKELRRAKILPRGFYRRDALQLAPALLGKLLVHRSEAGTTAGRIVEVEAYRGPADRAAHTYGGRRTPRNEVMWGREGFAYVYFIYGMHWCMNAVGAEDGVPEAVLLRALEPVHGFQLIRSRRRDRGRPPHWMRGPANLCQGMGIDREHNGFDLTRGSLVIRDAEAVASEDIGRSPRIGVDYAGEWARRPWRYYLRGSQAVSGPAALRR